MGKPLIALAALLVASPLAAQTAPAPSAEAEALGRRVAESGTLASLFPLLIAQDTEELVKQHEELDDSGKAKLRAVATATAKAALDRILGAIGHEYATRLSVADLKSLVAFNDSPAAKAWRAAEPQVIVATKKSIDGFDLKKEAWTAYCQSPGVKCPPPEPETDAK
ncbi:DUF2059 domain-containing protein [Sphingomonas panacisoli]|uniref:DUF2059 domain-containing protein n=1 Tax=Sphingomonas panacisoli TaxID=1813879 RepID=A0A5B8LES4_9SPHN|nr:DUF2059 domain-containing protein [Sphingomonas panacisoli]QDZ06698.1 DUF2059 domain-containing protein [Sphingomonas panacisoli]